MSPGSQPPSPDSSPLGLARSTWHHLVAGGVGGMVGAVVTSPLEVVKTRLQSSSGTSLLTSYGHVRTVTAPTVVRYSRIWSTLTHIVLTEGASGLFKGLGPTLMGVAPSRAIYFWSYSTCKSKLNTNPMVTPNTEIVHMASAASAGLMSSCTTNPLWVIKTRMQLERRSGMGIVNIVRAIYSERGLRGFWRGVSASAYGITETVLHFVIYEKLKKKWAESQVREDDKKTVGDFLAMMVCGGVSKTVATSVAYPHEVARTRLREAGTKYSTFWGTLATVHREEGVLGLYRGLGTNLVRQIPNTAVMMATYELVVYMAS